MKIEEILKDAKIVDSAKAEFIPSFKEKDCQAIGWLKTVAGYANRDGGVFFIGLKDKEADLTGFANKEALSQKLLFEDQVCKHVFPTPATDIAFLPFHISGKERFILQIEVKESPVKPVVVNWDEVPAIYMRRNGYTGGATYEEIHTMVLQSTPDNFDTLVTSIPYNPEDFQDLKNYYQEHHNGKNLSDEQLQMLGFFNEDGNLCRGAELFRDNYSGAKTTLECRLYAGFAREERLLVSAQTFSGNIPSVIQNAFEYIWIRMNHGILKLPDGRINIDAYSEKALLEAIADAVSYRDYCLDGIPIGICMFRDRLEIAVPGSFYPVINLEKSFKLDRLPPNRRNRMVSGLLEGGFKNIVSAYADADENHKPYILPESNQFTLVLPDLTYEDGIQNEVFLEYPPIENESPHDAEIIRCCNADRKTAGEIALHLGLSDSNYLRSRLIQNLVNQGYLLEQKEGRQQTYITNRELVTSRSK